MYLLKGFKYKEVLEGLTKHIDETMKDKEILSSFFKELVNKELVNEKLKLLTIDALDSYENKLKEAMNLKYTPISNHINSFDQATGEKFFDYDFFTDETTEPDETNVCFKYFLKSTKEEDPYAFTLDEIFEDFRERVSTEENLNLIKADIIKEISDSINDTVTYAESMVEALTEDKISIEQFKKRIQFRLAGVYALNIWRDNENN